MKRWMPPLLSLALLALCGCSSTPPKSSVTQFEGTWQGLELTPDQEGSASLTFSGQTLEFRGEDDDDWVKGTFTLKTDAKPYQLIGVITDCPDPAYVGKKSCAIYKFENGALTLTGGGPGNPDPPKTFDAPDCRQFVFQRAP